MTMKSFEKKFKISLKESVSILTTYIFQEVLEIESISKISLKWAALMRLH